LQKAIGKPTLSRANSELIQPISYAEFADGSLATLEFQSKEVIVYSPEGEVTWRYGRTGGGPGEFTAPYRIAVQPDQTLLVLDAGTTRIIRVSKAGKYVEDLRPDLRLIPFNMVALPGGLIAVSGITKDPRGAGKAIHIFNNRYLHLRSFGELPKDIPPAELQVSWVGGLTVAQDGSLIHTRFWPYEVVRYRVDGTEISRARVATPVDDPRGAISRTVSGSEVRYRDARAVTRPRPVFELPDGKFLGGTSKGAEHTLDLIRADGSVESSMRFPDAWSSVISFDAARGMLWVLGHSADEPVLLRVPFRF